MSDPLPSQKSFKLQMWMVLVVAGLIWFATLGYYAYRFHVLNVSNQPGDWGPFGSFLSGTVGPLIATINLMVTAHIAIDIQRSVRSEEDRHKKAKTLFDLYQSWNSSLYKARTEADMLLQKRPNATLQDFHEKEKDASKPIWEVLGFFETLQWAIDQKIVLKQDAVDLFGRVFVWWQVVCVKTSYPKEWDPNERVNNFHSYVREAEETKAKKTNINAYTDWVEYAKLDLKRYQANALP